jgi:O-antigen ligase
MVFVMLADIPKIWVFPASPLFFLLAGSLFLSFLQSDALLITAFKEFPRSLLWYLVLVLVVGLYNLSLRAIVSCFEGLAVFAVVFSIMVYRCGTALWTTRLMGLFYIASAAWMILSTFAPGPFAIIRGFLYAGHLDRFVGSELLMAYPTGFTFAHFGMGYQLSVGVVLALLLVYTEKGLWKLWWLASSIILLAAVILSGQRSTIPAIAVAMVIFLIHTRRMRGALLLVFIAGLGFWFLQKMDISAANVETMYTKVEKGDTIARIGWQVAALRIIAERPSGDMFGELNWDQEALDQGADFDIYGGKVKAVHNAYLGNALQYGWLGAALVLMTIWHIFRRLLGRVLDKTYSRCPSHPYALICVLALISAMVQALFHNANLFTLEPSTWIIFSAASAWVWLMRRGKRAGC